MDGPDCWRIRMGKFAEHGLGIVLFHLDRGSNCSSERMSLKRKLSKKRFAVHSTQVQNEFHRPIGTYVGTRKAQKNILIDSDPLGLARQPDCITQTICVSTVDIGVRCMSCN